MAGADGARGMHLRAASGSVPVAWLESRSLLAAPAAALRGQCVVVSTRHQLHTALALIELDGVAGRLVLCTPDLSPDQVLAVARDAGADAIVVDAAATLAVPPALLRVPVPADPLAFVTAPGAPRAAPVATDWVLLTSGTTGQPKLVAHTLESLAGALPRQAPDGGPVVWATFYDIRRYGGLQIFLRAVMAGTDLVLSDADEPVEAFLERAGRCGVTHISGTPSHWRRALMSGCAARISPRYVRLSGEIADQAILDNLRGAYPQARISHAFASTEAGVAFDVGDGRAGFPADFIDSDRSGIAMRVVDGTLRIRSSRNASRYLGAAAATLAGDDGFVDTGDLVERVGDRYYFRGRRGGVINVGGLKVHPEEVEAVLNADPRVRMSLVRARRNPITGAVVVADVVLAAAGAVDATGEERIRGELVDACRRSLPAHKVPAMLRIVPALEMTAAGKLVRPGG